MDPDVVAHIEKLLSNTEHLTYKEVNQRIRDLEIQFKKLFDDLPNFTINEKSLFFKLLTRSNDLLRVAMDMEMKQMNLTPEKLNAIFAHAAKSNDPASLGLINTLQYLHMQAEELRKSLARLSVKLSQPIEEAKKSQNTESKRVKRSTWQKP